MQTDNRLNAVQGKCHKKKREMKGQDWHRPTCTGKIASSGKTHKSDFMKNF